VEFFEGEIFTNFEVCGYLRKCSPQSLGVYVFWWHQWAICESLLCKNLFSTYSQKFLALYDICFCPQHLSIPLLDKALFFENCWLMFTFVLCKPIFLHNYGWLWITWLYIGKKPHNEPAHKQLTPWILTHQSNM